MGTLVTNRAIGPITVKEADLMKSRHRLLDKYERSMKAWGASPKTVTARLRVAGKLLDQWADPTTITTEHLSDWLAAIPDLKQWSRCTYHNHVRAFFSWLHGQGLIEANPTLALKRPRSPSGQPRPLTALEQRVALTAAHGNTRAWLLLALRAGLRAHEIAKVRGQDVNEDFIFVSGKGGKEAYIPTHPDLWALAQTYPRTGWWFPSPAHEGHISADSVTILVGKFFRTVGIEGSVHRARHSYATTLLRGGTNVRIVQSLMRHSSLATTAAYCAVDEDESRAAINRLGSAS